MYSKEYNKLLGEEQNELVELGIQKGLTADEVDKIANDIWHKEGCVYTAAGDFIKEFREVIDSLEPKK